MEANVVAEPIEMATLTRNRLESAFRDYTELRAEVVAVQAESALIRRRLNLLADLMRLEGKECDLPWERAHQ